MMISPLPRILPFHRLGSGRMVTASQVVRALRIVKSQPLSTHYRETFTSQDGGTGYGMMQAFGVYCQNEINRRGGLVVRQDTPTTLKRQQRRLCARARASECKWCGTSVGRYIPGGKAFCDASCYRSYYNT